MSLRQELQEFVDEVTGKIHPGEPLNVQIHHSVREFGDVIGVCLRAGANTTELANEAVEAARLIIPKLNLGPMARRLADAGASLVIPGLVEQAAPYAAKGQEFVTTYILPSLDLWIDTLIDIRSDLNPGVVE